MLLVTTNPIDSDAWVRLPTAYGFFEACVIPWQGEEHLVLRHGEWVTGESVLVRIHSECLTGDVLGSRRCDCGPQLERALELLAAAPHGLLIYLRGHEGRGIGLAAKLAAYRLQDRGMDTVDANLHLGLPVDARRYEGAAQILKSLGAERIHLLTNNPDKIEQLEQAGIVIEARIPLLVAVHEDSRVYLETKRTRLGHLLDHS